MLKKIPILGFQLIELLIVMVIISLLTVIGIPTFQDYFVQAHRATAKSALFTFAVEMEKYGIEHNSYQGMTFDQMSNEDYDYKILSATDTSYSITAIPIGVQAERDVNCGALILNSLGERKITGNGNIHACF